MNRTEKALDLFNPYNCCQATLSAFADELGLDRETTLKISSGFGGGLAKAEVCGIVSGIVMALGMKFGKTDPENTVVRGKVKDFMDTFITKHGSCTCKGLLGYDKSTAKGAKIIQEKGLTAVLCPKFMESGIKIAEELM